MPEGGGEVLQLHTSYFKPLPHLIQGLIPDGGLEAGTFQREGPLHQLRLPLVKYLKHRQYEVWESTTGCPVHVVCIS